LQHFSCGIRGPQERADVDTFFFKLDLVLQYYAMQPRQGSHEPHASSTVQRCFVSFRFGPTRLERAQPSDDEEKRVNSAHRPCGHVKDTVDFCERLRLLPTEEVCLAGDCRCGACVCLWNKNLPRVKFTYDILG